MNTLDRQILTESNEKLRTKLTDNLKDLILFGSRATGQNTPWSDYDFLIVVKQKIDWKTEKEISDLFYEIDLKYKIITDAHILSETEFDTLRGKQPIFLNALKNGYRA